MVAVVSIPTARLCCSRLHQNKTGTKSQWPVRKPGPSLNKSLSDFRSHVSAHPGACSHRKSRSSRCLEPGATEGHFQSAATVARSEGAELRADVREAMR